MRGCGLHMRLKNTLNFYVNKKHKQFFGYYKEIDLEAVELIVPQQPNCVDCGVYLLQFIEYFFLVIKINYYILE